MTLFLVHISYHCGLLLTKVCGANVVLSVTQGDCDLAGKGARILETSDRHPALYCYPIIHFTGISYCRSHDEIDEMPGIRLIGHMLLNETAI